MREQTRAYLLLLGVVLVWGMTFVLVKDALRDASPLLFNLMRMTLAFIVLVAVNWRGLRGLSRGTILRGLVVGAFLAAGYQLQTAGLARTTAAKSAFITGLVVVFVPLLTAIPVLRTAGVRPPGPGVFAGAGVALVGLLLLTTPAETAFSEIFVSMGVGDLLTLGCALAFAGHLLALSHASLKLQPGVLATLQIGAAAVLMALTLPLEGRPVMHLTVRLAVALGITGLLATAAAFTVQSYAQQHLAPTRTALILTLEPVVAWLTAVLFLGEHMGRRTLVGAALILAGIVIIELLPGSVSTTEIPA